MLLKIYNIVPKYFMNINNASAGGYLHYIEWCFDEQFGNINNSLRYMYYTEQAIDSAATNGHEFILDRFYEQYIKYSKDSHKYFQFIYSENAIFGACSNGHMHIIKWFFNHGSVDWIKNKYPNHDFKNNVPILEFKYSVHALKQAAMNGYLDIIIWFTENIHNTLMFEMFKYKKNMIYSEIITGAAEKGQIKILDWIYDNLNNLNISYNDEYAINVASLNGHIHVLNWFFERAKKLVHLNHLITNNTKFIDFSEPLKAILNPINEINFVYSKYVICWINNGKKINVLDWFFDHSVQKLYGSPVWLEYQFITELEKSPYFSDFKNIKTVSEFLNEKKLLEFKYDPNFLSTISISNNVNILDWFYDKYITYNVKFEYNVNTIEIAAEYGKTDILDWFFNHSCKEWINKHFPNCNNYSSKILPFVYTANAMTLASANGHVNVLNWFLIHSNLWIQNNHHEQWIKEHECNTGILLFYNYEEAFKIAKLRDQQEVILWWLNSGL